MVEDPDVDMDEYDLDGKATSTLMASLSFYILPHQQSKLPDLIIAKHFLISKYLSENFNGVLFIEFGIYAAFLADKSRTPYGFASTMNVFP